MAIVIKTSPGSVASVNNEVLAVVYEATKANDPVTYVDYKYVADIYVDAALISRLKVVPDPTYKMGIFDLSDILKSYVSYGFDASSNTVDYTIRKAYTIKYGEEYGGTLYTNLTVDSERYIYETYKPRPLTDTGVIANGLASNRPGTTRYDENEAWHLIPFFSNVSGITDLTVTWYNEAGGSLGTSTVSNAGYVAFNLRQANIGSGAFTKPVGTKYALLTGGGVTHRIDYMGNSKYDVFTLAWLNPFGGYDSQSFGLVSKKTIELEKREFEKTNYQIDGSGLVSYQANNVYYGSKKVYASTVKTSLKLTSHLLNSLEYTWLADLFISTDVYIYNGTYFVPVSIRANSYEYSNYANSKLKPLEFEVTYTDKYNGQHL